MKIALFTNYGGNHIPNFIKEAVKNNKSHYRLALVEELTKLEPNCDKYDQATYDKFIANKNQKYLWSGNSNYMYCRSDNDYVLISKIEFIDIDITRPWRIVDNDGVEFIEYFNGINILNELNEAQW